MPLDYLDYVFGGHDIDCISRIENESLDVIVLINVLHHLQDPICFLSRAINKLRTGGKMIMVEPYFSNLSELNYLYLHHEPTDFDVKSLRICSSNLFV
jgi:SAM-dependent methyltransferase